MVTATYPSVLAESGPTGRKLRGAIWQSSSSWATDLQKYCGEREGEEGQLGM